MLLMVVCTAIEARETAEKHYNDAFKCTPQTALDVSNRFGTISITNSDIDKISIDIVITIEANSLSKAQHVLEDIEIEMGQTGNRVFAKTVFDLSRSKNIDIDIHYVITMPAYVNTTLSMKYGDVNIDKITGQFDGEVRYGQFTANSLVPTNMNWVNQLSLDYSNGSRIRDIGHMDLDIDYSDMKINTASSLNFDARYSDLKLGSIARIEGDVSYSEIKIEKSLDIDIKSRYSDLDINEVQNSIILSTQYGEIDIEKLGLNFTTVNLDGRYSDIEVALPKEAAFIFSLDGRYADYHMPNITIERKEKDRSEIKIKGYNESNDAKSRVEIESEYGDVDVYLY